MINYMLVPGAQPWAKQSSPTASHDKADGPAKLCALDNSGGGIKGFVPCLHTSLISSDILLPLYIGCYIKDQLGRERSGSKQSETVAHYGGFILTSAGERQRPPTGGNGRD